MKKPTRPPGSSSSRTSWQQSMQEASPYLGLGMQLALTMAFFVVGGYFLDRWLGTAPWLLLAGALLGIAAFFVQLFRVLGELNRKSRSREKKG